METMQLWHEHSVNFLKAHQALCFFAAVVSYREGSCALFFFLSFFFFFLNP